MLFIPPSSALRAASPLKGEAVTCVNLARFTASPLRGEAERSSDEGDIDKIKLTAYNSTPHPKI